MVLASAERHRADGDVDVEALVDAALRGQAAGAEVEPERRQVDRRRRCTVTVAGAVRVAAIPCWRSAQRVERRGEAAVEPARARPRASASVPIASRPSAVKRMRSGSVCSAVGLQRARSRRRRATRSAAVERALDQRQAERVGDPGVGVERADAVGPTTRSRARTSRPTPWPTSAASRVIVASTAPVASTSASAASGAMSGAVEGERGRWPARCPPSRRRRSGGSGRRASSRPETARRSPATAMSPARSRTARRARRRRSRLPVTSAAVDLAVEADARVRQAALVDAALGDRRGERSTAIGRPSPRALPARLSRPPRRGSTSARSASARVEADVGAGARDLRRSRRS